MAKIDDISQQLGNVSAGLISLGQRVDALALRLSVVERHAVNPEAHRAAHDELRDLCANYGITELPKRDAAFGVFDPAEVEALYAKVRSQPGAQDANGVCAAHERTVERLRTIFHHMGWSA